MSVLQFGIDAVERGLVPDIVTRGAMRRLCRERQLEARNATSEPARAAKAKFIESMRSGPLAPVPELANDQHYELPPEFFGQILGARRKYSCCYFPDAGSTLDEAEDAALQITCERAQLADGQDILELGCGWGSLSLWMAEKYPRSRITAVSNSAPQRRYIEATAADRQIQNLRVITADMNHFVPPVAAAGAAQFDRVVSVEMFEHMRNYEQLLARIASWLRPDGKLFVHIFCHRDLVYPYETEGASNWMGRYFFTGGIMPSFDLLRHFDRHLRVQEQWKWNGTHYQRTAEAWLANLDANRRQVLPILKQAYGATEARRWLHRWRMFFLAVSELFGYAGGDEWFVTHALLEKTP